MRSSRFIATMLIGAATISASAREQGSLFAVVAAQRAVGDLLARYSANVPDTLAAVTSSSDVFARTVGQIELGGEEWIGLDRADEARRRLLAATFALDAADSVLGTTKQVPARRLFVWARNVMRPMKPDENVRTWHLASVALIQRAGYWDLFEAHRADAAAAMPGEPLLALASAVAAEAETWVPGDVRLNPLQPAPVRDLAALVKSFDALAAQPSLRPEALVRLGVTHLRMGHCSAALQPLADARAATKDARVVFLSHVAAAICADRMGDADAFAVHAGAAAVTIPGAQTGATLLAVTAIRRDRHEAASDALASFTMAGVDDPWLSYRFGDGYRWPAYRALLREAVRR
jgi:hypothetical protein